MLRPKSPVLKGQSGVGQIPGQIPPLPTGMKI
jgi:hypothetical protein